MSAAITSVTRGETSFSPVRKFHTVGFGALNVDAVKAAAWASAGAFVGGIATVFASRVVRPDQKVLIAGILGAAAFLSAGIIGGTFGAGMAGVLGAGAVGVALGARL